MSHSSSTKAVLYAFSANLGIALAKSGAAFWTGSGSLLAEAIHSFADCGNQILLFIGMKRSEKEATLKHPMGFGRESYVWSMMVAIILFSVGGLFAIYEGIERFLEPHTVENANVALLVLLIAVGLESFSLKGALNALAEEKGDKSLWQWFKQTSSSELMVVTGEDIAALLGLVIALITLGLTVLTGDTAFDAIGSVLIGVLLIVVAGLVGREVHSLIIGESAEEVRQHIMRFLKSQSEIVQVFNVWALYHGSSVVVCIKVEMQPDLSVAAAVERINVMERQIKQDQPRVRWIFFEIDNQD